MIIPGTDSEHPEVRIVGSADISERCITRWEVAFLVVDDADDMSSAAFGADTVFDFDDSLTDIHYRTQLPATDENGFGANKLLVVRARRRAIGVDDGCASDSILMGVTIAYDEE